MPEANHTEIEALSDELFNAVERADDLFLNIQKGLVEELFGQVSDDAIEELGLGKKVMAKRFSIQEVCAMFDISRQTIYKAEKDGRLPPPDMKMSTDKRQIRAGFTLEQVCNMRRVFGKMPPKLPRSVVVGMLNQKGGAQKTTTTLYLAQWLVIQGYKVLVIDTDAQGSLTTWLGLKPDIDVGFEHTIAPFVMQDEQAWAEHGEPSDLNDLRYAVHKTYFHNLDLIPACGSLLSIDLHRELTASASDVLASRLGIEGMLPTDILRMGIEPLKSDYDVILIDGTPSLNMSTTNVISACDEIVVPTPAHMIDFASTVQFVSLILEVLDLFMRHHSSRTHIGLAFMVNRYSQSEASYTAEEVIKYVFGSRVMSVPVEKSDEVQRQGNTLRTIYEVPTSRITNMRAHKRALENYNDAFMEIMHRVILGNKPIKQVIQSQIKQGLKKKGDGKDSKESAES